MSLLIKAVLTLLFTRRPIPRDRPLTVDEILCIARKPRSKPDGNQAGNQAQG